MLNVLLLSYILFLILAKCFKAVALSIVYIIYTVYVVCKSDEAHAILTEFVDVSTTLSQCNK